MRRSKIVFHVEIEFDEPVAIADATYNEAFEQLALIAETVVERDPSVTEGSFSIAVSDT